MRIYPSARHASTFGELPSRLAVFTATTQREMTRIIQDLPRIWSANS
jgi:hypothetical protein